MYNQPNSTCCLYRDANYHINSIGEKKYCCKCWCHKFSKIFAQMALGIIRVYCMYPSRPKWWTHENDLQVEQWLLGTGFSTTMRGL